ncbi:MAG: hypothetical protein SFU99_13030 [Saprospiraceae bacterium]|nr:hypothetical protein [Saprospiraceae bacterium]
MTAALGKVVEDNFIEILTLPFDMTDEEFFQFCQLNRDLQIEREVKPKW